MRMLIVLGAVATTLGAAGVAQAAQAVPPPPPEPRPYVQDAPPPPPPTEPRSYGQATPPPPPPGQAPRPGQGAGRSGPDRQYGEWNNAWGAVPPPPPAAFTRRGDWYRHVRACQRRYRTYDPRTDTFVARPGVRVRCRL